MNLEPRYRSYEIKGTVALPHTTIITIFGPIKPL